MHTITVHKSCIVVDPIEVMVGDAENESVAAIRTFAYEAAGESPTSCFGANVRMYGSVAHVVIHRD